MKILKFNELNLNIAELDKTVDSVKKGDILVNRIINGEDISFKPKSGNNNIAPVTNPDDIIPKITTRNRYDHDKGKSFFLRNSRNYKDILDTDNGKFKLNDIEKTDYFGSSGGASLGSKDAKIVESIQCIFLALRQSKGESLTEDNYIEMFDENQNIRQDLLLNVRVPITLTSNIINNYNEAWLHTFIDTSNALYEVRPVFTKQKTEMDNALSRRKEYVFYQMGFTQQNSLINIILKKYKEYSTTTKNIPISKWTPSDIWALEKSHESIIIGSLNQCRSFVEFNDMINSLFREKTLRGISLKKTSRTNGLSDIKIVYNRVTPVPTYKFNRILKSEDPFKSIGIKIVADRSSEWIGHNNESMYLRTFGGSRGTDISGEVIGHSAMYGKVGLAQINKILRRRGVTQVETKKYLLDTYSTGELVDILIDEIKQMSKSAAKKAIIYEVSEPVFSRILSKWQCLRFESIISKLNKEERDNIIQDMFYYGLSIKNDKFECPSYVRLI